MRIHLINPSDTSFGTAVITPRWMFVLAGATPAEYGTPVLCDETLERLDPETIQPGDIVGISVHTSNVLRGYAVGRIARERGAWVVFGGIHANLYPHEVLELGSAHAVVQGDGDVVWSQVLADCCAGKPESLYQGGRLDADRFAQARWDLLEPNKYMWASVQTVRGCAKHCSFCSVWRTDGQKPRQRSSERIIAEMVALRQVGFRFLALADDNFYPVTLTDLRNAERQGNMVRLAQLQAIRQERFELLEMMSRLPDDMVFFTQITMEASEDEEFLKAMRKAHIRGALVGIETVTQAGLKSVYKDFNASGATLIETLSRFQKHGIHLLGSFIFGLPSDREDTFGATESLAREAKLTFAQFVMLTPFPGTVDFERWEKEQGPEPTRVSNVPITRYWLIPHEERPRMFMPHPTMSSAELRERTQAVWDEFYSFRNIWERSRVATSLRARMAFVLVSKLYRQMYAKTGIAADSARRTRAAFWARVLAQLTLKLFRGRPMPDLSAPEPIEATAGPSNVLRLEQGPKGSTSSHPPVQIQTLPQ